MVKNAIDLHDITELDTVYPKLIKPKRALANQLARDGRLFVVNNNQGFGYAHRWQDVDPILVAQSDKRNPRYLWAVRFGMEV